MAGRTTTRGINVTRTKKGFIIKRPVRVCPVCGELGILTTYNGISRVHRLYSHKLVREVDGSYISQSHHFGRDNR